MSPPPLPPRHSRSRSDTAAHLTPSEPDASYGRGVSGGFHDPRSSSTQSLLPEKQPAHQHDSRRTLLLVFVHGFMGDETSFQSFPAHLHNVVALTLSETHVVHTKIYPRYRSRHRLEYATAEFSNWLQPHLGPDTDVILLGHSMGGLLTADVVLLPGASPQPLRHRILGTVSFDTPFLGMHPGVVKSGLASIFRPAPEKSPERQPESNLASQSSQETSTNMLQFLQAGDGSGVASPPPPRMNTLFSMNPSDPNYNPSFQNDVVLPVRQGWSNAWHFVNKHSDSLVTASKQLVKSHLEFGGAMADYSELKRRYKRIRALEEEDETKRQAAIQGRPSAPVPRVRFINFYTASTGRPKPVKSGDASPSRSIDQTTDVSAGMSLVSLTSSYQDAASLLSGLDSPLIFPPAERDDLARDNVEYLTPLHSSSESASPRCSGDMQQMSPRPSSEADSIPPQTEITPATPSSPIASPKIKFPDLPTPPVRPVAPGLSAETDSKARKAAERAHREAVKVYKQAVKQYNNATKEKEKQAHKAEKEARKEEDRRAKEIANEEKLKLKQVNSAPDVGAGAEQGVGEMQKTGEELRLEEEQQRLEAERQRMKTAEAQRLRVQRRMLGLPAEEEGEETPQQESVTKAPDEGRDGKTKNEVLERDDVLESVEQQQQQQQHTPTYSPSPASHRSESPLRSPSPVLSSSQHTHHSRERSSAHHLSTSPQPSSSSANLKPPKPAKDRKFCMLPSNHASDPTWIRVFMRDVDEVGAHCGLFFIGDTYAMLVGEVAATVERWVNEDVGERWARNAAEVRQVL